jgi:V8-like Glu-specific endopeptidase
MVFMINIGHRCGRKFCARYTVGILCVAFSLAIMRASAESPRVGMLGNGDRRVVEQLSAPWGAIGQINVTGYRRTIECTGSLIASHVVITAAHCIMDSWHQKTFSSR